MSPDRFIGIDVSKAWLDVAGRPDPAPQRVANDPDGIAELVGMLRGLAPVRIVLEATGHLELPLVAALQVAGLPVAVVNPRQVRDFARATGRLAKTDRLDAAVLAHFADALRPAPAAPVPDDVRHLDALLTRRDQLIGMRVMETNRLDRVTDKAVRAEVQKHVTWLVKAIDRADAALAEAVTASPAWRAKDALLRSIPGVGPVATLTLLAGLPELGTTTGGRLAALVGLAPLADDSGTRQGGRHIRGGRRPLDPVGRRPGARVHAQKKSSGPPSGTGRACGPPAPPGVTRSPRPSTRPGWCSWTGRPRTPKWTGGTGTPPGASRWSGRSPTGTTRA